MRPGFVDPTRGRRMRPSPIQGLDSRTRATASAGWPWGPGVRRRIRHGGSGGGRPSPASVTKPPQPLLSDDAWGVPAGGAAEPPPPLRRRQLLSLEGGQMSGATGLPARSALAPVVQSLRRTPPPTSGSVEKGLRTRSSLCGAPLWPRGPGLRRSPVARAGDSGRVWTGRHVLREEALVVGYGAKETTPAVILQDRVDTRRPRSRARLESRVVLLKTRPPRRRASPFDRGLKFAYTFWILMIMVVISVSLLWCSEVVEDLGKFNRNEEEVEQLRFATNHCGAVKLFKCASRDIFKGFSCEKNVKVILCTFPRYIAMLKVCSI